MPPARDRKSNRRVPLFDLRMQHSTLLNFCGVVDNKLGIRSNQTSLNNVTIRANSYLLNGLNSTHYIDIMPSERLICLQAFT